jgi:hypothetical protein
VEPGHELRALERAVLNRDPSLNGDSPEKPGPREPVPKLMPATIADFTGRQDEIAAIVDIMTDEAPGLAVPVVAISGRGGVGKSSLAIRVSHEDASSSSRDTADRIHHTITGPVPLPGTRPSIFAASALGTDDGRERLEAADIGQPDCPI